MADIRYEGATRIYPGSDVAAVDALDLHIADAELMVLVGPSGSGKSTALGCSPASRRSTTAASGSAAST